MGKYDIDDLGQYIEGGEEIMRAVGIRVEPFAFVSYLDFEMKRELNEHGTVKITGLIRQDDEQRYIEAASRELWVGIDVITESGEAERFFTGILTGIWIKKESRLSELTIELRTGSFLLDMETHTRSFQNPAIRYSDILHTCVEAAGGGVILLDKKEDTIGQFLMQYEESDWEFAKRLASRAGTVLIAESVTPGKKIYFGYRIRENAEIADIESWQLSQDYEAYRKKAAAGMKGIKASDVCGYVVRTREIYGLGESVCYQGRKFVIGKIVSRMEGQELYHEYHLCTADGGRLAEIHCHKLAGVSLKANVSAVWKTQIQVVIQEDENKANCGGCWIDYATVYSTPDGTGWYCMPEIGDTVRVVFPDEDESHLYAAGSVHIGEAGGRSNPDEKSWKNKQGKEILFTPDSIIMRNQKGLLLELSDRKGIVMHSDKDISIRSEGELQIRSQSGGIELSAEKKLQMQQKAASIRLDGQINIGGGKIYMN